MATFDLPALPYSNDVSIPDATRIAPTTGQWIADLSVTAVIRRNSMDIDFVRRYIRDAHRAHRVCVACLGVLNDGGDLLALARAARKREISWQGEATGPDGPAYQYRVHGSGYSFVDLRYGTAIHFDVSEAEGIQNIRFGASELFRYASSIGESISEENVRSELTRLSVEEPSLVHVVDGPFYYFYVPTKE